MKYLEDYLKYLRYQKNYSEETIDSYEEDLVEFFEFLDKNNLEVLKVKYENIRVFLKGLDEKKNLTVEIYKTWKDKMSGMDAQSFFCGSSGKCSDVHSAVINRAFQFISKGSEFEAGTGFTPTLTVNKTEVKWEDDTKGKYTKILDGTISNLRRDRRDSYLDLKAVCPECSAENGVTVKLYIGRDASHLVQYYNDLNYLTTTYDKYTNASDWYSGSVDQEYIDG